MNNKLNNMLNKFMEESNATTKEEMNKALQEFMIKYNAGEIEYKNTPLDDAYELLEKARNSKIKKQAIKLANDAYNKCHDCFDAILFLADLEENSIKREKILNDGLEYEKDRLKKEGYFEKDSIGIFYGIFETRPYIRGLYYKALFLLNDGKYKLGRDVCKEILRLNQNDNMGARYLLMATYAILEEEQSMLKLFKNYKENGLEMLFPLMVLYYKQENYVKAKEYLSKIKKNNPEFVKFFKGTIKEDNEVLSGYYQKGTASEVLMYFDDYDFFVDTLPNISDFILNN